MIWRNIHLQSQGGNLNEACLPLKQTMPKALCDISRPISSRTCVCHSEDWRTIQQYEVKTLCVGPARPKIPVGRCPAAVLPLPSGRITAAQRLHYRCPAADNAFRKWN